MFECKVCNIQKVRLNDGKRAGCTGFKKVDETGRAWNGRTCPDCKHNAIYQSKLRTAEKLGPSEALYAPKLRPCQTCKVMNPNYYECEPCRSTKFQYGCLDESMFAVDLGDGGMAGSKVRPNYAGWVY